MSQKEDMVEVYRLSPWESTSCLLVFVIPVSLTTIIEETTKACGGGKYKIKFFDDQGLYLRSSTFEIPGSPRMGARPRGKTTGSSKPKLCQCPLNELLTVGCRCGGA